MSKIKIISIKYVTKLAQKLNIRTHIIVVSIKKKPLSLRTKSVEQKVWFARTFGIVAIVIRQFIIVKKTFLGFAKSLKKNFTTRALCVPVTPIHIRIMSPPVVLFLFLKVNLISKPWLLELFLLQTEVFYQTKFHSANFWGGKRNDL